MDELPRPPAATPATRCSQRAARAAAPPAADRAARRHRPARPTRTSSSRSTSATSCTTAACPASTSAGSGRPRCWRCARRSSSASRPRCAPRSAPSARRRRRRSSTSRCARSTRPTTRRRSPATSSARRRSTQVREFIVHRSAYQLKEADPHSWAIPRLSGPPKAALVEIQADEYGGGRPERMHAPAVRRRDGRARARLPLRRLPRPAAGGDARDRQPDVAVRPAPAPARRDRRPPRAVRDDLLDPEPPLRRRACGGSASTTRRRPRSSTSTSRPTRCTRRSPPSTSPAGSRGSEPGLAADILLGARALMALEGRWARALLGAWEAGRSSLRRRSTAPAPASPPGAYGAAARPPRRSAP